jgi:probable HAF family extracellular repeat protein
MTQPDQQASQKWSSRPTRRIAKLLSRFPLTLKEKPMRQISLTALAIAICCAFAPAANAADADTYSVSTLPTLGGTRTQGDSINNRGWVAGFSTYVGNLHRHATAWYGGAIHDLDTLGGPNSSIVWPVKSNAGILAGISQTSTPEPLGERWSCAAFFTLDPTGYICRGFAWQGGQMRMLPTLGGNNGFAAGANDRGQITGWAETTFHDPSCEGPGPGKSGQVLQFLPVIYGPGDDDIATLPLIAGDSSGAATAINDHGQAVGISGSCDQAVGRYTAAHAVLWDNGTITDIGAGVLQAAFWNTPMMISERGDVVGFAGDPSDATGGITHAFLWTPDGGMQLLNNDPADNSTATGINAQREVVGYFVAGDGNLHAFVWDAANGMRDLNDLKQADYTNLLALANDIDDAGEITGRAVGAGSVRYAFVATPSHR